VTDGNVWIFFRATRTDGIRPKEGKAILFPTFNSIVEDFPTFFELLSAASLSQRLHLARLAAVEGVAARPREARHFVRPIEEARMLPRTDLGRDVADIFNRFFAGLSSEQDAEMRHTCFVETRESRDADATLVKIAGHLTNAIRAIETRHGDALQTEIQSVIDSKVSEVCLIVGNKGAGKSTFISRFFSDVLPAELRRSCVVASIDLADYTGDESTIQRWLAERLCDTLEDAIFTNDEPTYEDYQGMFFRVYRRWSEGTYKHLYKTDRTQFRIQFGDYIERRRRESPDDYAIGLMLHAAAGRRRLPCIVFDNTDQFPLEIQEKVFQFGVALRNAALSFIIVPITDRSIWRLSKSGVFQSYLSRSFYLPSPAAKEVLARRIHYLRMKLDEGESSSGTYFSSRGIRISIGNLNGFVNVLEDAFVRNEMLSNLIWRLANYDIRRMLLLAQRAITSPTFAIEELIRIYVDQRRNAFDIRRGLGALVLGDYDRHLNAVDDFIQNLFWTEGNRPVSPLLLSSILAMLDSIRRNAGADLDRAYINVGDLTSVFEPCGVDGNDLHYLLDQLLARGLIEAFDPNNEAVSDGTKVGITNSGGAHIEMALNDAVYIEQMALTTGYRYVTARDEIVDAVREIGRPEGRDRIRAVFKEYILTEDENKFKIPSMEMYKPLQRLRVEFAHV
jgi:hypothetical protein